MNRQQKKTFQRNIDAVKEMAIEIAVRSVDLLDPTVWTSPETALTAVMNVGRAFVKDRLQKTFADMRRMREAGELDEDLLTSEKGIHAIMDFARFVGQENPDPEIFDAAKKIFIETLRSDVDQHRRATLYRLLNTCRQLNGEEIMILAGAHALRKEDDRKEYAGETHRHRLRWSREVAQRIGFSTEEEVLRHEDHLVSQMLIYPPEIFNGNRRGEWTGGAQIHRLTNLGISLTDALAKK